MREAFDCCGNFNKTNMCDESIMVTVRVKQENIVKCSSLQFSKLNKQINLFYLFWLKKMLLF